MPKRKKAQGAGRKEAGFRDQNSGFWLLCQLHPKGIIYPKGII